MKHLSSIFLSFTALALLGPIVLVQLLRSPLSAECAYAEPKTISAKKVSKKTAKKPIVADKAKDKSAQLLKLNKNYGPQSSLTADVKKTTKLALLNKTKTSVGTMALSKGKLALELEGDEKTLVVVDGVNAWVVSFPPKEFKDAPRQVLRAKIKGQPKEKMGLAALLSGSGLSETFKVLDVRDQESRKIFSLTPKKVSSDFKKAELETNFELTEIKTLTYWDELENESRYEFTKINSSAKPSAKRFKFTPSSKDEVTEIE